MNLAISDIKDFNLFLPNDMDSFPMGRNRAFLAQ